MRKNNRQHFPIRRHPVHLTYRLAGSLPMSHEQDLLKKRSKALDAARVQALSYAPEEREAFLDLDLFRINAKFELAIDAYLHDRSNGPYFLADNAVAAEIMDSLLFFHRKGELYVYVICVMSNHVHVVVRAPDGVEEVDLGALMKRHKTYTARTCNILLNRAGQPFWEKDYFDRTVRKGKFNTVMWYVLNNPVKAGLVNNWREWTNTWLNPDFEAMF